MKYTLWEQETHDLWFIEADWLPLAVRDYTDLIYVSSDRWDKFCAPGVPFSPDAVFMSKKRGINASQVVVVPGLDKHGNATRQWFVRVRFGMLPTEHEREQAGAMIWPVSSAVAKASQERLRNDPRFADSSLLTTNSPTENAMSMAKMADLGYATRCTVVPRDLELVLTLTADWGMRHHPSIGPMLDGESRRTEAWCLEWDCWIEAWRGDEERWRRWGSAHWMTEEKTKELSYYY